MYSSSRSPRHFPSSTSNTPPRSGDMVMAARTSTRRVCGVGVDVLMDGAGRDVDHVAGFPFVALDLGLRFPLVGVGDLDVAVLVQVVAKTLDHVEAFLGEMTVLAGAAAGRNHLHVGVDRLHARVHLRVEQMLQEALPRHFPRHVFRAHDLAALGVTRRRLRRVVEQRLVELPAGRARQPRLRFIPGHWRPHACKKIMVSSPRRRGPIVPQERCRVRRDGSPLSRG